jgi:predicted RNase H-related nuclease YkuK (DUF458 family)
MEYKKLQTKEKVDLIPYIKEYIEQYPDTVLICACDSQNQRQSTVYAITLGLYRQGKGAHVLYNRFDIPRERDTFTRLFKEVQYSVDLAENIREKLGIRVKYIDIDLNNNDKYKSNMVLASAVGFVTAHGYRSRCKGENPMLTYASDSLLH